MNDMKGTTVHASCVLVGRSAVLIRGPSGSGKSRLALNLIEAVKSARLVADDRVHLFAAHGRLIAAAPNTTKGKIEIRGFGIREVPWESMGVVRLVVDLAAEDAARMPEAPARSVDISGVKLSRLPMTPGEGALPPVLAALSAVNQV